MYRLTTTRYEFLEVSKKIVDGYPKESIRNSFEFNVELKAEATETTPKHFEITLKQNNENDEKKVDENIETQQKMESVDSGVEITMCEVDELGNIIKSEVVQDVVYT